MNEKFGIGFEAEGEENPVNAGTNMEFAGGAATEEENLQSAGDQPEGDGVVLASAEEDDESGAVTQPEPASEPDSDEAPAEPEAGATEEEGEDDLNPDSELNEPTMEDMGEFPEDSEGEVPSEERRR